MRECLALFEQFVLKLVEIVFQFACPAATARTIMGKQLRNYEVYALERECVECMARKRRLEGERKLSKLLLKRAKIAMQSCALIPAYLA